MIMIKTISYDQEEIIQSIIKLYCSEGIELDPTYSKGVFYKGSLSEPRLKFDVNPVLRSVTQSCATSLPIADESVFSIMFDPPFLATTGKSLKSKAKNNIINKRFGVFKNEKELHSFYIAALAELYRVCKPNGFLIFKCQDKVSSGKQYFSHCFIHEEAKKVGWYARDLFVLLAKNRIVANWQKNQKHARKYHSYFWVFQKKKTKVSYTGV